MSPSGHAAKAKRAARVKLLGSVLALVQLESGKQFRVPLHQLSISGGLLMMEKPLDEGIKIEVMFHVGTCTVRSKAVVLFPMWATQGCLQPFEFTDLADEDRSKPAELMLTEISVKFTREAIERDLAANDMRIARWYTDPAERFALCLCAPAA